MAQLFIAVLLIASFQAAAEELIEFHNGDVIRAEEFNHNFEKLESDIAEISALAAGPQGEPGEKGDKGDTGDKGDSCTVEQVDNSAVISCTDGTSAVIAGAGTLVVLPEGVVGEAPDVSDISVGAFYWQDGNSVILSRGSGLYYPHDIGVHLRLDEDIAGTNDTRSMYVHQIDDTQELFLVPVIRTRTISYAEFDCQGTPFWVGRYYDPVRFDGQLWVTIPNENSDQQTLFKSYRREDTYVGGTLDKSRGATRVLRVTTLTNPTLRPSEGFLSPTSHPPNGSTPLTQ